MNRLRAALPILLLISFSSTIQLLPAPYVVLSGYGHQLASNILVATFKFHRPSVSSGQNVDNVFVLGLPTQGRPGEPILPFSRVRLMIPQGKQIVDISVRPDILVTFDGSYNLDFGKNSLPLGVGINSSDRRDEAIFQSSTRFPSELYSDVLEQEFRGYKILSLNLHPVIYIPKTGKIGYYSRLDVIVRLEDSDKPDQFFRGLSQDQELVRSLVANPSVSSTYNGQTDGDTIRPNEICQYIIITNSTLYSSFQPLVDWKISKGLSSRIALVEDIMKDSRYSSDGVFGDGNGSPLFNDKQAHIRNFIKDAYLNSGLEYVLLGGDDPIIPARGMYDWAGSFTDLVPSDLYFGGLDGSWDKDNDTLFGEAVYHWLGPQNATAGEEADFFAEVFVGRAAVDTPQEAANFVTKTIDFEQFPQAAYLNNALLVGQTLDDVTQGSNSEDAISDLIPQFTYTRLYDRDGTYSKTEVISALNEGVQIVSHNGHSNNRRVMDLQSTDIHELTNAQYFMVYSIGCYAAAFDETIGDESVAEHFLRAEHGAFAFIGNSRYGWYTPASNAGPGETYANVFFELISNGTRNLGKALQISKEVAPVFDRWTCFTLNLLGDPETELVATFKNPTAHMQTRKDLLSSPHIAKTINITGTAMRGVALGSGFNNYTIDYGNGTDPSSWLTSGISLSDGGHSEVANSTLAAWNLSQLSEGVYTLRLTVNGGSYSATDRWIVKADKLALSLHIRSDGSVDPASAPITRVGQIYTLTGDVFSNGDAIVVERDNIVLDGAGHTVQGNGTGIGVQLLGRHNVTIKNLTVRFKQYGFSIKHSSANVIRDCAAENSTFGIWLFDASNVLLIGNDVNCNYFGISLVGFSENNTIVDNLVANSTGSYAAGVYLYVSSNNRFYHNAFVNNMVQRGIQIYDGAWDCADPGLVSPSFNSWDNGYPSGGNYWSNYAGTDLFSGANQNETGSDGFGDQPYTLDSPETIALDNKDSYPLIMQWTHTTEIVELSPSKTVVGKGYNITVSITLKNNGDIAQTINISAGLKFASYRVAFDSIDINLSPLATTQIHHTWNTSDWVLGTYTLNATVHTSGDDYSLDDGYVSVSIIGDLTGISGTPDGVVNMTDIEVVLLSFGSINGSLRYSANFDLDDNQLINMAEVVAVLRRFGNYVP